MATKTMAELYVRQGHFQEACRIYEALAEKDPFDLEIQNRLKELKERVDRSSPPGSPSMSKEEKIRYLEKWLANIRKRKTV